MKYSFLLLILLLPAEQYGQHRFDVPGMSQSETRTVDASQWRPFDSETIAVQTALEVGVVGLGMGAAWIVNENTSAQNSARILPILLITPWLIPAAAYYGGDMMGGDGTVGGAVIGLLVGGAVPILAGISIGSISDRYFQAFAIACILAGPIVGYHLSASTPAENNPKVSWEPMGREDLRRFSSCQYSVRSSKSDHTLALYGDHTTLIAVEIPF